MATIELNENENQHITKEIDPSEIKTLEVRFNRIILNITLEY